ncbi:MAG: MoaD/ThiS family protein [Desulfobacterales bacterium]|nr:MoaD/ThiS family protein [Desulfobacterales bacterium]
MGSVLFNAFSFLQKKLKAQNIPCVDAVLDLDDGQCVQDILDNLGIAPQDIEGVFVNGKIAPLDTLLHDGDRIAALPPGTPGPYRLLLGLVASPDNESDKKRDKETDSKK